MSEGPNHPSGQQQPGGGRGRRRRRGRRGPGAKPGQPGQQQPQGQPVQQQQPLQPQGSGSGSSSGGGGFKSRSQRKRFRGGKKFGKPQRPSDAQPAVFSSPMDHNYRGNVNGNFNGNGNGNGNGGGRPYGRSQQLPQAYQEPHLEPVPAGQPDSATRIFAFIEDLFFFAKIQETARKLNVKVEFVKTEKDVMDRIEASGQKPSLIMFDLNNHLANPLKTIPKLKKELKKDTNILGFVSHIQGDLKLKAIEAGCDTVVPRSAFSQNLPNLLRRHGAPDEIEEEVQ